MDEWESIEFKYAFADTVEKLETVLENTLLIVIQKIADKSIVSKVMTLLSHINKRVKAQNVKLPGIHYNEG